MRSSKSTKLDLVKVHDLCARPWPVLSRYLRPLASGPRPHRHALNFITSIVHGPLQKQLATLGAPRRSPPVPHRGLQAPARDHRGRTRSCQRHSVEQVACTFTMHALSPYGPLTPPSSYRGPIGPKGGPLPEAWRIDPSCADGAHGNCAHCAKDPDGQSSHRALQELPNHSAMPLDCRVGARNG